MIRLLIVDDEPIIADGLFEILQNLPQLELDLYKAYSPKEAIRWLNQTRFDIVLTDIRMPGMTGLELMERIQALWPKCKIIFLTGYNDFEYVYKAIQFEGVHYLLKTEGYLKVVALVESVIKEIRQTMQFGELIENANLQMQAASQLLQKEYIREILKNEFSCEEIKTQFEQLAIPLDPSFPVILVVGQFDQLPKNMTYSEKCQYFFSVKLIFEQYLTPAAKSIHIADDRANLIWLIQPAPASGTDTDTHEYYERAAMLIKGTLEVVQTVISESLQAIISFALSEFPVQWEEISKVTAELKHVLTYKIINETQMIFTLKKSLDDERNGENYTDQLRLITNKLDMLESYFEQKRKDELIQFLVEVQDIIRVLDADRFHQGLEIYYKIALALFTYINRAGMTEQVSRFIDISKLVSIDQQTSLPYAIDYIVKVVSILFQVQDHEQEKRAEAAITRIQSYIEDNLANDLSLPRLANLVYFNPSYLSRLFKKITGYNLTEYVHEARIKKAKHYLAVEDMKIHDVAEAVGFNSATNFTRFFKKHTGFTPQEYRESKREVIG